MNKGRLLIILVLYGASVIETMVSTPASIFFLYLLLFFLISFFLNLEFGWLQKVAECRSFRLLQNAVTHSENSPRTRLEHLGEKSWQCTNLVSNTSSNYGMSCSGHFGTLWCNVRCTIEYAVKFLYQDHL